MVHRTGAKLYYVHNKIKHEYEVMYINANNTVINDRHTVECEDSDTIVSIVMFHLFVQCLEIRWVNRFNGTLGLHS